jgi:hypothetical protein
MGNALGFGQAPNLGNVEVTREGFCGRLQNALCGVCVGFVLFFVAIFLLGWNEFNYVRNQAVLLKVEKDAVEVGCTVNPLNNGSPVWASCPINQVADFSNNPGLTSLPSFTEKIQGAWFKADSQIYQWVESKDCNSKSTTGGGKETTCTYDYSQSWVSQFIDSSTFFCYPNFQTGCQKYGQQIKNYGMTIPSQLKQTISASDGQVAMGQGSSAYFLNSGMFNVFASKAVGLSSTQSPSPLFPNYQVSVIGSGTVRYSYTAGQLSNGDVQATFTKSDIQVGSTQVSAIAQQSQLTTTCATGQACASLIAWNTKLSGTMAIVNWAALGRRSKDDMISDKESENGAMVMILRFVGFILMFVGLQLVTGPIALVPEVLPFVGECIGGIVGAALCCMNLCISTALSLVVIGAAWVLARPLVGLVMLFAAGVLFAGAFAVRGKCGKTSARAPQVSGGYPLVSTPGEMATVTRTMPQPQQFNVVCPAGAYPGQMIRIQAPSGGSYDVQVPAGIQPGQQFSVQL